MINKYDLWLTVEIRTGVGLRVRLGFKVHNRCAFKVKLKALAYISFGICFWISGTKPVRINWFIYEIVYMRFYALYMKARLEHTRIHENIYLSEHAWCTYLGGYQEEYVWVWSLSIKEHVWVWSLSIKEHVWVIHLLLSCQLRLFELWNKFKCPLA